jgi:Sel1 repeat
MRFLSILKKTALTAVTYFLFVAMAAAQHDACDGYYTDENIDTQQQIVDYLLGRINLRPGMIRVRNCSKITFPETHKNNNGGYYIALNPNMFAKSAFTITKEGELLFNNPENIKWAVQLAHELGHVLNWHDLSASSAIRKQQERDADKYAGYVLCRSGIKWDDIEIAIRTVLFGHTHTQEVYDDVEKRLQQFCEGYTQEGCKCKGGDTPPIAPTTEQMIAALAEAEKDYRVDRKEQAFPIYFKCRNEAFFGNKHQLQLGWMYANGKGTPQSDTEAVKWYRKAAEQGYANAQFNLGCRYESGKGVEQSDTEAVKWYRKAAEQGYASAQFNLGWMYAKDKGVEQSNREAVKWYRKAAEQGNANAQCNLGWMYEHGKGVEQQSNTEAVKWYRKAAEQGNAKAQQNLTLLGLSW